jgi:hypothetical protein
MPVQGAIKTPISYKNFYKLFYAAGAYKNLICRIAVQSRFIKLTNSKKQFSGLKDGRHTAIIKRYEIPLSVSAVQRHNCAAVFIRRKR